MVAHVWRMRAKKKKAEDYEKFGRQMTLPALRKIKGCQDAHFMRVESRKRSELHDMNTARPRGCTHAGSSANGTKAPPRSSMG